MASPYELLALARARAQAAPDRVAYVDYDTDALRAAGPDAPLLGTPVTEREFWERTLSLAAALRARGVGPGDTVAVQLPNRHEFVICLLALYAIGAKTMPVSPIYRSRDLRRMLEISLAVGLVVPTSYRGFDYIAMVRDVSPGLPALRLLLEVGPPSHAEEFVNLESLVDEGRGSADREEITRGEFVLATDAPLLLNFTSGTTGEPKGVLHSSETLGAGVLATAARLELSEADTIFVAATLGHAGGFLNGIFMPLLIGARPVFMSLWDADVALRILAEERVSYGAMMPTYLVDLTAHPRFGEARLDAWRTSRVSGGVIPRGVMDTLHRKLPQLRLCPGWGLSETLYVTCAGPGDPVHKRNSTDGRPVGTCELSIRTLADGVTELPLGEVGEIVVKAPSLMVGYANQPVSVEEMYTPDGWFRTGDLGSVDNDGYLTVWGRLKEIILRGGENVPVVEVETLLMEHEKVREVSVVGVPDARLGERACAVIVHAADQPPLEMDEMRSYLTGRGLTRQFIPEYLVACERLPVSATGKVRKSDVKEIALRELGLAPAAGPRPSQPEQRSRV